MTMHMIPNSGPFNDPVLDEGRAHAMIALDSLELELPPELIAYLIVLEQHHLELIRQSKAAFLSQTWRARRPHPEDDAS